MTSHYRCDRCKREIGWCSYVKAGLNCWELCSNCYDDFQAFIQNKPKFKSKEYTGWDNYKK
jgi:hypothetical protein